MIVSRAHRRQPTTAVALPPARRLPLVRHWKMAGVFLLLLVAALVSVLNLPGHVSPVVAAQWSSSVATLSGNQAAATPKSTPLFAGQQSDASMALRRINQLDPSQYASQADATIWSYSTCSAAALTEVIDAWGNYHYRIADVLKVEAAIGAITPALGLTTEAGIANTAAKFGFQTSWGHTLSLDQVITAANSGTPVIVSFPPDRYPGGHILVVRGGDQNNVDLADSSRNDWTQLTRTRFLQLWEGFSAILTPSPYNIVGKPTISATYINSVLASAHSPAVGLGQQIVTLGKQYGIDPVFVLAIFQHESGYGTTGEARRTFSPGNERCVKERPCVNNLTPPGPCLQGQSCYAQMSGWSDGFDRLDSLLLNGYVRGQITGNYMVDIDEIMPTFAPGSDGNNTQAYIQILKQEVTTMRQQSQTA